jgi:hypothetical protein
MNTVTADISANLKKLKKLESKGLISIFQIKIETPSPRTKHILPTAVWDQTNFDECVFGSEESSNVFEKIKKIIGNHHIKDAMHLADHIRDQRDYFITEDTDILKCKEILESEFENLKIFTPHELETYLS